MKIAIQTVFVCLLALICAAQTKKNYKDQGEYEMYNEVTKDIAAKNFSKAITDLLLWEQKYPDSEFKDDRELLFVQSYSDGNQPAKAVDASARLLPRAGSLDAASQLKLLFAAVRSFRQLTEPTPQQIETGQKAARDLLAFDKKPEGLTDETWTQAKVQLQNAARDAAIYASLLPGTVAMKNKDCRAAESAFQRALSDYPESAQAAWYLGTAQLCLYKEQPDKVTPALYAFARAAVVDPQKGMVDPQWQKNTVDPYLQKIYENYHGADPDGLKQLKTLAAASPLPPNGFTIKSKTQIAQEKQAQFEASNPQLALWLKIKAALADTNGEQYFASTLKDSAVPQLKGVMVEARPACRPKELLVAVPLPDATGAPTPEIRLKLDKPLTGKPQANTDIQWEGVPTAFTPSPFLLTMDTETGKVEGLKSAPCGVAAPVRKKR